VKQLCSKVLAAYVFSNEILLQRYIASIIAVIFATDILRDMCYSRLFDLPLRGYQSTELLKANSDNFFPVNIPIQVCNFRPNPASCCSDISPEHVGIAVGLQ
jgi:hypothetical protein